MSDQKITLREINRENVREICRLKFSPGQLDYIIHNCISIAESQYIPSSNILSIYLSEKPIGFIMYLLGDSMKISRFMIDAEYQGKGYGTIALSILLSKFDKNKFVDVVNKENNPSVKFWIKNGFEITDKIEGLNVVFRHSSNN